MGSNLRRNRIPWIGILLGTSAAIAMVGGSFAAYFLLLFLFFRGMSPWLALAASYTAFALAAGFVLTVVICIKGKAKRNGINARGSERNLGFLLAQIFVVVALSAGYVIVVQGIMRWSWH